MMSPGARTSSIKDEAKEEWRAVAGREAGRGWRVEADAGRAEGMDMGLADLGRMAERRRGEGREGTGDGEVGMAWGEDVRLRRTVSLGKRLLKMREESLWGEILGLCWMGGQMSCAEQCNMGSRGRGTRRTSRSDEAGRESERADVRARRAARRRRETEKRRKKKKI